MANHARLKWVDIGKGIGILAVMLVHAGTALVYIGPYYMPMFITLSGVTFRKKSKSANDSLLMAKRCCGLYFRYSFWVLLLSIPLLLVKKVGLSFLLRNIIGVFWARDTLFFPYDSDPNIHFFEFGNGPLWYLAWLSASWLFYALLLKATSVRMSKHKRILVSAVLLCTCLLYTFLLRNVRLLCPWSVDAAGLGAIFLCFGSLVQVLVGRLKQLRIKIALLLVLLLVYYLVIRNVDVSFNLSVRQYSSDTNNNPLLYIAFCILGTTMFILFCIAMESIPYISDFFSYIGRHSLALLAFHSVLYRYWDYSLKSHPSSIQLSIIGNNSYVKVVTIAAIILSFCAVKTVYEKRRKKTL